MSAPANRSLLLARGPGPSLIAAAAAVAIILSGTTIEFGVDGLPAAVAAELPILVAALFVSVALVHAAVLVLASRLRSPFVAVPALLAATTLLPVLADALRPVTGWLMRSAAPALCRWVPDGCPPQAWTAFNGFTFGLFLLPFLLVVAYVRARDAHDDRARAAWLAGALMIAVATVMLALGFRSPTALPLTAVVGLAFMVAATLDTWRRRTTLAAWLREGLARVRPATEGGAAGLRPFVTTAPGVELDGVLHLVAHSRTGAYRSGTHDDPVALVPLDPRDTLEALARHARTQGRGLAVATLVVTAIVTLALRLLG